VAKGFPKGVWFQKKRLATGETVRYAYYGRGPGMVALGREGSPELFANLAEAMKREPPGETVSKLIWEYRQSPEFMKLRHLTQRDYLRLLDRIQVQFGTVSLRAVSAKEFSGYVYKWRDSLAASPRRADYAVAVLKALLAWGKARGRIAENRALGIKAIYHSDRSDKTWTPEEEAAFLAVAPAPLKLAFILAVESGQSQGDLLRMTWAADQGEVLVSKRNKTGKPVAIPISPRLRAALDAAPKGRATTILTKADGLPWEPKGNGFRAAWQAVDAKVAGRTFNDLRGTFISRRRAVGWSAEEVALCSGHPVEGEKGAMPKYVDRLTVAIASAKRIAARERIGDESCKPDCKPQQVEGAK